MTAAPPPSSDATPAGVLAFWFEEIEPAAWWRKSDAFDRALAARFGALLAAARACELHAWRATPDGRLAEVIVLDQFARNIHRDTPAAFAGDPLALALAQEAVARGDDRALPPARRLFLYMPYMHSESRAIHALAPALFASLGPAHAGNLDFEHRHKAIVDRFGRFPHRNAILGRPSTPEELAFLRTLGSGF
ncbi:MAG TPA: DUF924 family protein [Burkholderiaceae bacterium]